MPKPTTFLMLACLSLPMGTGDAAVVVPEESNEFLLNPGKGWVLYGHDLSGGRTTYFPDRKARVWGFASVTYLRFHWADIQPEEGRYAWDWIDSAIAESTAMGKKFAFGIMNQSSGAPNPFITPKWVFDAGAHFTVEDGKYVPVWDDPVFLKKQAAFVTALAERYNGNPAVAYIDDRSYGNWGEWNGGLDGELMRTYVDMWSCFDKTPVIVPASAGLTQMPQGAYGLQAHRFGLREDSSDDDGRRGTCAPANGIAPAVSEWSAPYADLKTGNTWNHQKWRDDRIPLYNAPGMSCYTYDCLGEWGDNAQLFLTEKEELIKEWQNRMGYWFKLKRVAYPDDLGADGAGVISFDVRNDGVASIYVNWRSAAPPVTYVRLALLDAAGAVIDRSAALAGINPFSWKPGMTTGNTATFRFAHGGGAARLAIGVFSDPGLMDPDIAFANTGRLGSGWYPLGMKR